MRIPAWLDASFTPLVDATVRGAIILLAVLALTHLMRRRSAAARHALWAGAVCAQLLLVGWALAGPRWSVAIPHSLEAMLPAPAPVVPLPPSITTTPPAPLPGTKPKSSVPASNTAAKDAGAAAASNTAAKDAGAAAPRVEPAVESAATVPASDSRTPVSWRTILLVGWALGAVVVLLRLAFGTMIVAALARRGARVDDGHWLSQAQRIAGALGITRPLTLLHGDRVEVPITWGVVYPVVLLPADADTWPDERRQFVLVHEMAHVKRLDALTQLVGQFALALFWFNPLVWIANRRMQLEREHACDDYVLRLGTSASLYAEELLTMVRALGTTRKSAVQPAFAALAMARRSEFEGRMLSILDPALSRRPLSRARGLAGAVAALLVVVPLAALRPYHAASATAVRTSPDAVRHIYAETGDEFPSSFKVSITPDTGAESPGSLVTGLAALAASLTKTDRALQDTGRSLASKATTSPKSCGDKVVPGTTIRSVHDDTDDDGTTRSIRYFSVDDDHCTDVRLNGKVTFTEDETGISSMAPDAVAVFLERTRAEEREVIVRPSDSGLTYAYTRNGVAAPFDGAAQAWFGRMVAMVLRESAVNAGPRVARVRAQGGVDAVLRMIAGIHSSGSKRAHYLALLDQGGLSSTEADRLVRQAGREISSSGDLRAVLVKAAPLVRGESRSVPAVEQAAAAVPSSGDRTAVLMAFGATTDKAMLLGVMRVAETIPSSGDKARLLSELTVRYFEGGDAELRDAYFRTLDTVPSSGDKRRVLIGVLAGYAGSPSVALDVVAASSSVASSGDRAAVLLGVANSGALRDAKVREAYLKAADALPSMGDRNRVLAAAARR
jgi:beta-lactamase regulating signal transducer with metallopeptidase domain